MSMIDTFLKAVGFDPAEFAQACEYYKKEFEMMKTGLQGAVSHFNNEFLSIRKENAQLHAKIDALTHAYHRDQLATELKSNGHDHNRNDVFGRSDGTDHPIDYSGTSRTE